MRLKNISPYTIFKYSTAMFLRQGELRAERIRIDPMNLIRIIPAEG
jgi:hypothetical protein